MSPKDGFTLACPTPHSSQSLVLMAHGGGCRLMKQLLEQVIVPAFRNPILEQRHDCALLSIPTPGPTPRLAFTTDSYVVRPLIFPGGDIGTLAVNGTVNDLAMGGARPLWLSVGLILEEGLPLETLQRVTASMRRAADAAGVQMVTGDTKVVDRGKGDGIYINTSGIGVVEADRVLGPRQIRSGDAILLSGDIGRHGMAIMASREGIQFEGSLESDCAPLARTVLSLLEAGIAVRCLRDLTRGGLASALVEIAEVAGLSLHIHEEAIPVQETVQAACEVLGFDPLHVACEGRFSSFVSPDQAEQALAPLRRDPLGTGSQIIGTVAEGTPGLVTLRSRIGANRNVDMLSGELLPRIC